MVSLSTVNLIIDELGITGYKLLIINVNIFINYNIIMGSAVNIPLTVFILINSLLYKFPV